MLMKNETSPTIIVIVDSSSTVPTKLKLRGQLIHGRLTRTKSTGSGQDPELGSQTAMVDAWCLDLRWGRRPGDSNDAEPG